MGTVLCCAVTGVLCAGVGYIAGASTILNMPLETIASMKEELKNKRSGFNYKYEYNYQKES